MPDPEPDGTGRARPAPRAVSDPSVPQPVLDALDLTPARWIWLPGDRCLANTFVLFRRELDLPAAVIRARGWIVADSRYRLSVNGRRIQWGPAISDPREQEVDPVDVSRHLAVGPNVIGVEVCYFGHGDGTWPIGAPGLLMLLDIDLGPHGRVVVATDRTWRCRLDRAHRPGQHSRWLLRALQEHYDARQHPRGWDEPGFTEDGLWLEARELPGGAATPSLFAGGPNVQAGTSPAAAASGRPAPDFVGLRPRSIPLLREEEIRCQELVDAGRVDWRRPTDDWFECRIPGCFEIATAPVVQTVGDSWVVPPVNPGQGIYLTAPLPMQVIGFPWVDLDAPAGTHVELMVQESHDPTNGPRWLDTYFWSWSRLICREGPQRFEAFDWESCRWLQLHIHGHDRPVRIRGLGVRRRVYDWPVEPAIHIDDPDLQRLMDAAVNTLRNSCLDANLDGGGRERQQYSGDCGHQQQAARYAFGEFRLAARYLRTFSCGITHAGYFLDCWPAVDRLVRVAQRELGATPWGPILDHSIGFVFDCHDHVMESGQMDALREVYPRLCRFADFVAGLAGEKGLIPVEGLGVPSVWLDHDAYRRQVDKRCALNLYAAAMFEHALPRLARLLGDGPRAAAARRIGRRLRSACVASYWSRRHGAFVNNLPTMAADNGPRFDDRSLATTAIYGQAPTGNPGAAARLLAAPAPAVGESYPANAIWRLRALTRLGRSDVVVRELRQRWARMPSVLHNNSLQETWRAPMDAASQYSHCALAPICVLMTDLVGLRPAQPGFRRWILEPRVSHLPEFDVTAHTGAGPFRIWTEVVRTARRLRIRSPRGTAGRIVLGARVLDVQGGTEAVATLSRH